MSEKPCNTCDTYGDCGWTHNGKDFVCCRGYVLTAEDKERLLKESMELLKNEEAAQAGEGGQNE